MRRHILGAAALLAIALQFPGKLVWSSVALALWLLVLGVYDPSTLKRLWKPRFWLITIAISLASGLFLGRRDVHFLHISLSSSGLMAGALMVIRGALIFALTTWGASLLTASRLERWGSRIGQGQLTLAAATALRLIPDLIGGLQTSWSKQAKGPRGSRGLRAVADIIYQAASLAESMAHAGITTGGPAAQNSMRRVAIIGARGSGKTTMLRELARLLQEAGVKVGGVIQPAIFHDQQRAGYLLEDITSHEQREFAQPNNGAPGFTFSSDGWLWAAQRIREARLHLDVVVVDELGRIEATGGGHLTPLQEPLPQVSDRIWLLGVRADAASVIEERLGHFDRTIAPTNDALMLDGYVQSILLYLKENLS